MTDITAPVRRPYGLWLSVLLNVVLLSALGTILFRSLPPPPPGHDSSLRLPDPHRMEALLPPERRELVRNTFMRHRESIHPHVHELRRARRAVGRAMRAEPLEVDALGKAFERQRDAEAATAREIHAMLIDLVQQLTPEERRALNRLMREGRRDRDGRRSDRRDRVPNAPASEVQPAMPALGPATQTEPAAEPQPRVEKTD